MPRATQQPIQPSVSGQTAGPWLAAAAAAGFVFIPIEAAQFVCLGVMAWFWGRCLGPERRWQTLLGLMVFCFAAAFLLTPVSAAILTQAGYPISGRLAVILHLGLILFGVAWMGVAMPRPGGTTNGPDGPRMGLAIVWFTLLVLLHLAAWSGDISLGGDEHYHIASVNQARHLMGLATGTILAKGLLLGWLGLATLLAMAFRRRELKQIQVPWPWIVWALCGFVLAAGAALAYYPDPAGQAPAYLGRALRYPAAQSYLSGILGMAAFWSWGRELSFSFETHRMLPLLSILLIGLRLAGDRRWRRGSTAGLTLLAIISVTSAPTILYHGTMLYLELPAVALMVVMLLGSERWLSAGWHMLRRSSAYWGSVLLGFMKDTAIVAAAILFAARAITRVIRSFKHGRRMGQLVTDELKVGIAILGPGTLYLFLRSVPEYRPYQLHLDNLLNPGLWARSLHAFWDQYGLLIPLAMVGGWILWGSRRRGTVILCTALFAGMWLFHFCEDPRWIGLARFNLLLYPSLLVPAWHALTRLLLQGPAWCKLIPASLLGANLLMSPVNMTGDRADWGHSGEKWYRFVDCFYDIHSASPGGRILVGNLDHPYAFTLAGDRVGWRPDVSQLSSSHADGNGDEAELGRVLAAAGAENCEWVIFASAASGIAHVNEVQNGFRLQKEYVSRTGRLRLYRRDGSEAK